MNSINMSSAGYSSFDHATLRLHQAINEFKQKETDKSTLNNKLNILKQKCETNRKKAKLIESQIGKMHDLKLTYRRNKEDVDWLLFRFCIRFLWKKKIIRKNWKRKSL